MFLNMYKKYYSGFWTVKDDIKKLKFKNPESIFNQKEFKEWNPKHNGTYWQQTHNRRQFPHQFAVKDIDYNVPYLEFANIPETGEYDPLVSIEDTIMIETRNEIRVWCWLIHQLNGPYEIEVEFDEDYSERNIDGARMVTKFKWESNFDGSYRLSIDNKLTVDKTAKTTVNIQLPNEYKYSSKESWRKRRKQIIERFKEDKNPVHAGHVHLQQDGKNQTLISLYDIGFHDKFHDVGDLNDRYDDEEYLQKKYGVPNYLDALDIEKYKINLKRTFMTGKH